MPLSSLSPSCWPLSRKDIASKSVKIFVHMRWWHILYVEGHQRGLELSLQKWLRDEKAVITMEGHFITPTGEGAVKLKFNSMLIVYFWHHRFVHREFNPPPHHKLRVLQRQYEAFEGGHKAKVVGSMEREEYDSSQKQWTLSPRSPHSPKAI